jgi:GNAT superfamily N-acetyltransferase
MSWVEKIRRKMRHGLVLQWLNDQLINLGVETTPFYWIREGVTGTLPNAWNAEDFRDFSFVELGPDDMEQIAQTSGDRFVALEELQQNICTPGVKCFALKHHGEIACFSWFNLNECSSYLRPIPMKENEAYFYDMYTMRAYRGRNLAPYLRLKAIEYLKTLGKDVFYSITVCFNRPSINFKKKLGAEFLELHLRVMFFRRFGFTRRIRSIASKKSTEHCQRQLITNVGARKAWRDPVDSS